jgi:hypothetical protein
MKENPESFDASSSIFPSVVVVLVVVVVAVVVKFEKLKRIFLILTSSHSFELIQERAISKRKLTRLIIFFRSVIPKVCSADHWWFGGLAQVIRQFQYKYIF